MPYKAIAQLEAVASFNWTGSVVNSNSVLSFKWGATISKDNFFWLEEEKTTKQWKFKKAIQVQ